MEMKAGTNQSEIDTRYRTERWNAVVKNQQLSVAFSHTEKYIRHNECTFPFPHILLMKHGVYKYAKTTENILELNQEKCIGEAKQKENTLLNVNSHTPSCMALYQST